MIKFQNDELEVILRKEFPYNDFSYIFLIYFQNFHLTIVDKQLSGLLYSLIKSKR